MKQNVKLVFDRNIHIYKGGKDDRMSKKKKKMSQKKNKRRKSCKIRQLFIPLHHDSQDINIRRLF